MQPKLYNLYEVIYEVKKSGGLHEDRATVVDHYYVAQP